MPYNQLTNLDYFDIKNALRDYLRANSSFTDYDFEGSVLTNLLDVLAYNTYYTAFNTNMVANEMFLDSATLRENVVARAKELGYVPNSAIAPKATVSCTLKLASTAPTTAIFKRGSGFISVFENNLYQYVLLDDVKSPVNNGYVTFNNIDVFEGNVVTTYTTVGSTSPVITLTNIGVDVSTIRVKVYAQKNSTSYEIYTPATNILTVTPDSKVYFVSEIEDENYRITFGDGVFGKKVTTGNYIEISYLVTNGDKTNSSKNFVYNGQLTDENSVFIAVVESSTMTENASYGGSGIETIDSIKRNAPAMYGTQNRAVTSEDYSAIIRRIYPSVADIYTFGGEEANPPEYGKVKIVIKPSNTAKLTTYTKRDLEKQIKSFCVGSVVPEIMDPSILYIELTSKIFFDPNLTNKTGDAIRTGAIQNIENYIKLSDVEKFGGKFRYSRTVSAIDSSDRAVRSNLTSVTLRKDFYPSLNNSAYYELCFNNAFDYNCEEPTLQSTGFVIQQYPNYTCFLQDMDGKVILYRIDSQTGTHITINSNLGTINYEKGEIKLYDLNIIKGSFNDNKIQIRLRPKSNDINAVRETFLQVDIPSSTFSVVQE